MSEAALAERSPRQDFDEQTRRFFSLPFCQLR